MQTTTFQITGTRSMLMHAATYADPINPLTKAHKVLTSKRVKTEEDHIAIAKSEWRGGLYYDETVGPYIPLKQLMAVVREAAKSEKKGKLISQVFQIVDDVVPLQYEGPRDVEGLWDRGFYDARSVVVSRARVMRYRPCFRDWSAKFTVAFDPEALEPEAVERYLSYAGDRLGLGDCRPDHGRFSVEAL